MLTTGAQRALGLAVLLLTIIAAPSCARSTEQRRSVSSRVSGALGAPEGSAAPAPEDAEPIGPNRVVVNPAPPPPPREMHFRTIVLDTHVDTTQSMADEGFDIVERHAEGHLDIPRMVAGGLDGAFFSIWVDPSDYRGDAAFDRALAQFDAVHRVDWRSPAAEVVDRSDEVRDAVERGQIALLLGVEGGHALGTADEVEALERLHLFRALGARYMTLTWSTDNPLGHSSTGDHPERGLTPLGRRVVAEMNRIGMVVDVSHVSDQTFWDVTELTTRPLMASHSSARALADHPRNMTDDMLRAVAARDGVVCVNYYPYYIDAEYLARRVAISEAHPAEYEALRGEGLSYTARGPAFRELALRFEPDLEVPSVERIADHIVHIAEVAGTTTPCLGSDFDGVPELPAGMDDVSHLPALSEELGRRGIQGDDLARILGENVLRVLRANEPGGPLGPAP